MGKFILQVSLFTLLGVICFATNITANYCIYTNEELPLKKSKVLIIGDSHANSAIDTLSFPNSQNIARSSEPLSLTIMKLNRVLAVYRPDTIILSFSHHNISKSSEFKFFSEKRSEELYSRYYPLMTHFRIKNQAIDCLRFAKVLFANTAFYPRKEHLRWIGKFKKLDYKKSDLGKLKEIMAVHYLYNGAELSDSDVSASDLDAIIEICMKNKIQLILVGTPLYNQYFERIPERIKHSYNALKKKYKNKIVFIDFTQKIYPDSLFFNADHLNSIGADRFNKELMVCIDSVKNSGRLSQNGR